MPLIVDGHNLIAKLPSLNLAEVEDERRLIELLQEYSRVKRKQVEVYFDRRAPGQPRAQRFGNLVCHFARPGYPADQAIRARLQRLGNEARNWEVVSSDSEVQASARAARARAISSEVFARHLLETLQADGKEGSHEKPTLESQELDDWLRLFGAKPIGEEND